MPTGFEHDNHRNIELIRKAMERLAVAAERCADCFEQFVAAWEAEGPEPVADPEPDERVPPKAWP